MLVDEVEIAFVMHQNEAVPKVTDDVADGKDLLIENGIVGLLIESQRVFVQLFLLVIF